VNRDIPNTHINLIRPDPKSTSIYYYGTKNTPLYNDDSNESMRFLVELE